MLGKTENRATIDRPEQVGATRGGSKRRGSERRGSERRGSEQGGPAGPGSSRLARQLGVGAPTLDALFDSRHNALNLIRLCLAVLVIVWHSFPLTGHEVAFAPLRQLMGHISVDAFFAISGYLIVSSWLRRPQWRSFLRARVLRIMPAFWVSLVVTAFVIAPLGALLERRVLGPSFWPSALGYVWRNCLLWVNQYAIDQTPVGVPFPGVWNGSMWTLAWEFLCYLGVLALGLFGLFRFRSVLWALFGAALAGVVLTSYGPVHNFYIAMAAHFGVMFLAGALVLQIQGRLPLTPTLMIVAGVAVLASAWLPDYRLLAAFPLAYLVISLGALGRHPRLQFHTDLSYGTYIFAFPLQQLLVSAGALALGVAGFAMLSIAATLLVATASWFGIERPALRLKRRRQRAVPAPAPAVVAPGDL